jgi:hypothetical protein
MKTEPLKKYIDVASEKKKRTDEVTRKVAIAIVFIGVFVFFIKLLFF